MVSKTRTNKSLHKALVNVPGFKRGYAKRDRIIKLGKALRKVREIHLKLNQKEAAALVGMEQSELSRLEAGVGERGPSMLTIGRIMDAYEKYYQGMPNHGAMALTFDVRMTDAEGQTTTVVELIGTAR